MPPDAYLPAPDKDRPPARGRWRSLGASIALIGDKGPAGRLLRRVLPASVLTIGASGFALYAAHGLGYIGVAASIVLIAAVSMLLILAGTLRAAWLLAAEHGALVRLRSEVRKHAVNDPVTGLANRGQFMDQLARRAALADRRTSVPFAVCSLELGGMDEVTRRLGDAAVNRILAKAADVIRDCVRASDLVARLDDGKFGILLEEIADPRDIDVLAERVVSSVPAALEELAAGAPPISVSIGIVMKSSGEERPVEMLHEADAALQLAKRRGPGRFELTTFAD